MKSISCLFFLLLSASVFAQTSNHELGLMCSPQLSGRREPIPSNMYMQYNRGLPVPTAAFGIIYRYHETDQLIIGTGLWLSVLAEQYTALSPGFSSSNLDIYKYVDFPIFLNYLFFKEKKFNPYVDAGLVMKYVNGVLYTSTDSTGTYTRFGKQNAFVPTGLIGIGLRCELSSHIILYVEPNYQTTIVTGDDWIPKLYSIGISISTQYRF